jgi:hypothetical protein
MTLIKLYERNIDRVLVLLEAFTGLRGQGREGLSFPRPQFTRNRRISMEAIIIFMLVAFILGLVVGVALMRPSIVRH